MLDNGWRLEKQFHFPNLESTINSVVDFHVDNYLSVVGTTVGQTSLRNVSFSAISSSSVMLLHNVLGILVCLFAKLCSLVFFINKYIHSFYCEHCNCSNDQKHIIIFSHINTCNPFYLVHNDIWDLHSSTLSGALGFIYHLFYDNKESVGSTSWKTSLRPVSYLNNSTNLLKVSSILHSDPSNW